MANEKRLIDAYALIQDIEKRYCEPCKAEGKDYCEVACRACWVDDMILEIDPAPTVDAVEVVHAEWIEGYIGRDKSRYTLECSSCGFYFKTPCEHEYQIQDYKKDFEHCPCCCALMDGGNEDVV